MSSEKFKKLLEEMQECVKSSQIELESKDKHHMSGWAARKNGAIQKLEMLKGEYLLELGKNMTLILPMGTPDESTKFAVLARDFGGCYWADMTDIAKELSATIEDNLVLNKQVSVDYLLRLGQELQKMYDKVGMSRPMVDLPTSLYRVCNNKTDVLNMVRDYLACAATWDFALKYIQWKVSQTALDDKFDKELLPVVVSGLTSQEIERTAGMSNRFVVKVNGKKIDRNYTTEVLKKIKDTLHIQ